MTRPGDPLRSGAGPLDLADDTPSPSAASSRRGANARPSASSTARTHRGPRHPRRGRGSLSELSCQAEPAVRDASASLVPWTTRRSRRSPPSCASYQRFRQPPSVACPAPRRSFGRLRERGRERERCATDQSADALPMQTRAGQRPRGCSSSAAGVCLALAAAAALAACAGLWRRSSAGRRVPDATRRQLDPFTPEISEGGG